MHALPAHTVKLVLQYITPLSTPLPPHLVSVPLRQRHHFLHISPASPVDYLCWPSPDSGKVIRLLDHLPSLSDQTSYPTRYTSDPESTFAHVQVSSDPEGLRMLFHWDGTHAWQYHDLQLMPFPSSSFSDPRESLVASSGLPSHPSLDPPTQVDQAHGDSDDSYWDSYGATSHDLTSSSLSHNVDTVGEDAYWAQYASVQGCGLRPDALCNISQPNFATSPGSADSTIPSPLPASRKLRIVDDEESAPAFPPQHDPIIDVPTDTFHSRPQLGVPSPDTLAHLLAAISPRRDACSPVPDGPHLLQLPSSHSALSLEQATADSESTTPPLPAKHTEAAIVTPVVAKINGEPLSQLHPGHRHEGKDRALTESVKGLYYLWKIGRKGRPGEEDRNTFLRIVQEAVANE